MSRNFYHRPPSLVAFILLACLFIVVMISPSQANNGFSQKAQVERGKKMFHGEEKLKASIEGHKERLAPNLARCINCHAQQKRSGLETKYAPILDHDTLQTSRARRGGPAFAYNKESFCRTVRTGIDPEYVILNRTMPRFDLNDQQCQALWSFLTENPSNAKQ